MRIIAVGIGGAGSRIVDSLYATDRKSSKVACVQGLAIDVDEESMKRLSALPDNARMCFSALEPGLPDTSGAEGHAAPIDISEIISRVQNLESGENDAIFLCCGLGGGMSDVASHIIAGLRSSVVEPIFGLVTLPCLAEGERISSKAADDIEMLSALLDGIIVFDNETWYKKIKSLKAHLPPKEKGFAEKIGLKKSEKPLSPAQATYQLLNEALVRRISLILRAGEFKADGGIDLAEVVLDSGEVLNTMKGMGFITIGYAVEQLPHDPLRFLSWLKPAGLFDEEQKKKASRIVELAKQAIYHEISTPCDLTSAHKALVLVAGPSHELSMKGFMTVRKWIDRSIAGLETRSGDYPVMNTKNVAIIVMLSGLENIPRIAELKEIRAQSKPRKQTESDAEGPVAEKELKIARDDMISLPARKSRDDETGRKTRAREEPERTHAPLPAEGPAIVDDMTTATEPEGTAPNAPEPVLPVPLTKSVPDYMPESSGDFTGGAETQISPRRRVVVMQEETSHARPATRGPHTTHKAAVPRIVQTPVTQASNPAEEISPARETERQRIERELRRQRTVAIGGHPQKTSTPAERSSHTIPDIRIIKRDTHKVKSSEDKGPEESVVPALGEKRTVIIGKRRISVVTHEKPAETENSVPVRTTESPPDDRENVLEVRSRVLRAKDEVFGGKGIRKPPVPPARDSTLLHTELRPKKTATGPEGAGLTDSREDPTGKDPAAAKKRGKSEGKDQDLSWI